MNLYRALFVMLVAIICYPAAALERTGVTFKIFQFPANMIPRIDGNTDDWSIVPDEYVIGSDQLVDDTGRHTTLDPNNLDVRVRVGSVMARPRPSSTLFISTKNPANTLSLYTLKDPTVSRAAPRSGTLR